VAQVEEHRFQLIRVPRLWMWDPAWNCEILAHGYGVGVVAHVAVSSGLYRHSQRMYSASLQDLFGVKLSLGSVNQLRQEARDRAWAAAQTYAAAKRRGDG